MIDPAHLIALSAVLRCGSFEAAAGMLNVTPSAVSQRIKALEERMGTVLVIRAQPCRGTVAGQRLARHCDDLRLLEQGLVRDLGGPLPAQRPTLRIAVNADSLATWFLPALAALPDVLFDLVIDDQDHSEALLRRGEVVAAVTALAQPAQGCDCHALGSLRYIATASPGFRDRWFPDGITAATFAEAPAITFNAKDRLQADWVRQATGRRPALPSHVMGSSQAFIDAALEGLGWGMNPEPLVRGHLATGQLVTLCPGQPLDVALYWQASRLAGDALAPLTRSVRAAAAGVLIA